MINTVERGLDLLCGEILKIEIFPTRHIASVYMQKNTCTDMTRTIQFFQSVDPDVVHIHTFADGHIDTQYIRTDDPNDIHSKKWVGGWRAI
jgi:hypothetical protein